MQDERFRSDLVFRDSFAPRPTRRAFLRTAASAGISLAAYGLLSGCANPLTASDNSTQNLETTTLRLTKSPSMCAAPGLLAQPLLQADGFSNISYRLGDFVRVMDWVSSGEIDITNNFAGQVLTNLDAVRTTVVLAAIHVGCFVLFGNEQVHEIPDLKGKTLTITAVGGPEHAFLSSMMAYVGLDPNADVTWETMPGAQGKQLFMDGKTDAFLAFPPVAQELEAKKIGHVVVNSMTDYPWSQYFCCLIVANRDFVRNNPEATKRALRAHLQATDLCALHPDQAAQFLVKTGYTNNYEYALQAMREIPYNKWRAYDPEDTLRFYGLRLHDVGMIKHTPNELIAAGTDWSFLNQVKQELKPTAVANPFYCTIKN